MTGNLPDHIAPRAINRLLFVPYKPICASPMLSGYGGEKACRTLSDRSRGKKTIIALIGILCVVLAMLIYVLCDLPIAKAAEQSSENEIREQLSDAVRDAIEGLDVNELEDFIASLSDEQKRALGIDDVKQLLSALVSGQPSRFFENMLGMLASTLGTYFAGFLPSFVTIIIICMLKNMLGGLTGDFMHGSATEVVHIVCYSAIILVLMTGVISVMGTVIDTITALTTLSQVLFPILLTLLSMLGGTVAVATYTPFMAVLSTMIMNLVTAVIVPAFIATIVFSVVGNISSNVKLDKLIKLIRSASTWLIGIVFGLFATFLTVQGITGGIIDKFGFNVAKFALSSYVPILGGYLSDGFDLLSASLVLVKNAVGYVGAAVLVAAVLFPLIRIVLFTLVMRLTSAVAEPIGDARVSGLMHNVAGDMSLLITALMGVAFLFFILIMLLIGSCNPGA